MGSFWSMPNGAPASKHYEASQMEVSKKIKMSSVYDGHSRLIPALPDEISLQILARLPRMYYLNAKMVSRSWKAAVTSSELYQLRKETGTTEDWLYILSKGEDEKLIWYALDPVSTTWQRLPPMPNCSYRESRSSFSGFNVEKVLDSVINFADVLKGWLGSQDAHVRVPFSGCAIGAVDGCLYVLGGFSRSSAMKFVLQYDPRTNDWLEVSPMTTGRAFCKTGLLNNKLYVVGGVNRGKAGLTPLQSAEVYDPKSDSWTPVANMPFSKAQVVPNAFLVDLLKPIATGMTSYRGRLCVPQSLYSWPFFVDVGGEIYDPEGDTWAEMPPGMGEGWPARQAGTKLSVVVNGELYALDPSTSTDSGKIKVYDHQQDAWKVVIEKVPVHNPTDDSESPYLLAAFLGKLHVIAKDENNKTIVLQADLQKYLGSESSTPTPASSEKSSCGDTCSFPNTGVDPWKVLAGKNFGSADLVSCQVINM